MKVRFQCPHVNVAGRTATAFSTTLSTAAFCYSSRIEWLQWSLCGVQSLRSVQCPAFTGKVCRSQTHRDGVQDLVPSQPELGALWQENTALGQTGFTVWSEQKLFKRKTEYPSPNKSSSPGLSALPISFIPSPLHFNINCVYSYSMNTFVYPFERLFCY